jgi:addiction module HigA family antidote
MAMHNPAHPGEVIRESCLKPLGLTVREAAEHLGVTRKALSDLLNEHSGVSPEMALRLEKAGSASRLGNSKSRGFRSSSRRDNQPSFSQSQPSRRDCRKIGCYFSLVSPIASTAPVV